MFYILYTITEDQDLIFYHRNGEWNADDSTALTFESMKDAKKYINSNWKSTKSRDAISVYPLDVHKHIQGRESNKSYVLM